jgi:hypothetical protein
LIELKATGQYFACYPTPGYQRVYGSLLDLPDWSPENYAILLEECRALNLDVPKKSTSRLTDDADETDPTRPGSIFNAKATMEMVHDLLIKGGFTEFKPESATPERREYTRPDKEENEQSGNLALIDGMPIFWMFSSNADPFIENESYTPFKVRTVLEFSGDWSETEAFSKCAKQLWKEGYRVKADKPIIPDLATAALLGESNYIGIMNACVQFPTTHDVLPILQAIDASPWAGSHYAPNGLEGTWADIFGNSYIVD